MVLRKSQKNLLKNCSFNDLNLDVTIKREATKCANTFLDSSHVLLSYVELSLTADHSSVVQHLEGRIVHVVLVLEVRTFLLAAVGTDH